MEARTHLNTSIFNFTAALVAICLLVYILVIGKAILIPLVTAVVIWYLMVRLANVFSNLPVIGIHLPNGIAIFLAVIATGYILYMFVNLVGNSIYGIVEQAPQYQAKIKTLMDWISQTSKGKLDLYQLVANLNLTQIFSNLAVTLTNIAGNLGVIIIYVLFLMLEYKTFDQKIKAMATSPKKLATSRAIIERVVYDINAYMKIKTGVSLLTAAASYIALVAFGISYAQFWALLIFILNFIPTLGSIIAVAVTLLAISIHFHTVASFALLAVILVAIQLVVGNIIEPRLMGRNLNLSPLVILLSLAFWGAIWGVVGMFLCVPLMTIINIILAKFERTRFLAMMLAADPQTIKS